jgi:hypothetical protein
MADPQPRAATRIGPPEAGVTILQSSKANNQWALRVLALTPELIKHAHPTWNRARGKEAGAFMAWYDWSQTEIGTRVSAHAFCGVEAENLPVIWSNDVEALYELLRRCANWIHTVTVQNSMLMNTWLREDDKPRTELSPYTDGSWMCNDMWEERLAEIPTALVPPQIEKEMDYSDGATLDFCGGPSEGGIWGQAAFNAQLFGHNSYQ